MQAKPTYQQLLVHGKTVISQLKKLQVDKGWQKTGDKPCDVYKMGIDNLIAAKGVAIVNFPMKQIYQFLDKVGSLALLDDTCIQEESLFEEKDIRVLYFRFKAPWPVSHRDFALVSYNLEQSANKIYMGSKSCNYPHPEVKDVVRAQAYIGGYILEKIDQHKTKVTYMSFADIKGSIPTIIKNQLSKKQGQVAGRVQEAMKKGGHK